MDWLFELTFDEWGSILWGLLLCYIFSRMLIWRRRYRKLTDKIANNVARMERNG